MDVLLHGVRLTYQRSMAGCRHGQTLPTSARFTAARIYEAGLASYILIPITPLEARYAF